MNDKQRVLEDALNEINAALASGSLTERRQYRFQADFERFDKKLNAIENRMNTIDNQRWR